MRSTGLAPFGIGGQHAVLLLAVCMAWLPAVAADDEDCALCHEDVAEAFVRSGHALAPGWNQNHGCQSCHGPGDDHMEEGGGLDNIIRPQLLSPREGSDNCLSCHQRQKNHFAGRGALHRLNDVGCLDCHSVHANEGRALLQPVQALCADCHQAETAQFEMVRSHPMGEGGPGCVSCHDPHGSRRAQTRSGDGACATCHFSQAGPFLYDHDVSIVDGCTSCHEVHGSTNRHLLKHESQVNLCYECHNANLTPGWHSAQRFTTQKCTACHGAIHGSNTNQFFLEE